MLNRIYRVYDEMVGIVASAICTVIWKREGGYKYWKNLFKSKQEE